MRAGKLRNNWSLFKPLDGQTNSGEPILLPPLLMGKRFISVEPLMGRELIQAQQVQADVTHKVTVRGDSLTLTVKPKWKWQLDNRTLNILSVMNKEDRGFEVEMMCKEEV